MDFLFRACVKRPVIGFEGIVVLFPVGENTATAVISVTPLLGEDTKVREKLTIGNRERIYFRLSPKLGPRYFKKKHMTDINVTLNNAGYLVRALVQQ